MNFEFSDDQKLIQDQARQFLSERSPLTAARAVMDGNSAYDKTLWKDIAELGWCGTAISEEYGGLGLGPLELCVIAQELGRALTPVPFFSTIYLAADIIQQYGSENQKKSLLPKIASGQLTCCLATTEIVGQQFMKATECQYSDGKITGKKIAVLDGSEADLAIVTAIDHDNKQSIFLVDLHQQSVFAELTKSLDSSRPLASINFDGASAEPLGDDILETENILTKMLDRAAVFTSFEQLGGCEATMQMGIDYTKQRFAFGRSIASFQAIKHIFADMYVAIELARSNAYFAAWALSANDPKLPLAAATARVSAVDAFYFCSKENIEVHGGMGFTWEFDCHLYYKRAQLLSSIIGSSRWWREQVVDRLLNEPS